jgi:hypothetical protein
MLKPIARARIFFQDPGVYRLPRPYQNIILINTPNRLVKFKRDCPFQVARIKRNKFKPPYNI